MKRLVRIAMPAAAGLVAMGGLSGCASSDRGPVYRQEPIRPVSYETRTTRVVEGPTVVRETQRYEQPYAHEYSIERWDDDGDGWDDVEINHGNREVEIKLEEKYDD